MVNGNPVDSETSLQPGSISDPDETAESKSVRRPLCLANGLKEPRVDIIFG